MKIFLQTIIFSSVLFAQTLEERITLKDGRILKLYKDGTYKLERKKSTDRKISYNQLVMLLRNMTPTEVKEVLGKPTRTGSNKELKNNNNEYVDVMNDKMKGDTWSYDVRLSSKQGAWDPVLEKYESLLIYFYKGKVYSVIRNETY